MNRATCVVLTPVLLCVSLIGGCGGGGNGATQPSPPTPPTQSSAPTIQSISITVANAYSSGSCGQLQVTATGQNLFNSSLQLNGVMLSSFPGTATSVSAVLPLGFEGAPGTLSFTATSPGGVVSAPFSYPASSPPVLALCITPPIGPITVFAGTSFVFDVQPSEVNLSGNGTLTLGSLPVGITSASMSLPLPAAPITTAVPLNAANSTAPGSYSITFTAAIGTVTQGGSFGFTIATGTPPNFFFSALTNSEVEVPIGGSGSIQFGTTENGVPNADYAITASLSALPPGTSAILSPNVFPPGGKVTVILTASGTAPVTQNASITLTGTPSVQVASSSVNFLADVTQPSGSLPGNRSDFVPTAGTPYAAVYDPLHNLIFSSNPSWNRVDVISNATHQILKSIPVRSPRGMDITQDDSLVWVQTESQNVFAINTASLQANHYVLPSSVQGSGLPAQFTNNDRILALSDGTLFIFFTAGDTGVWNIQTNQLTVLGSGLTSLWTAPIRSGDGTRVYAAAGSGGGLLTYDVSSQSASTIGQGTPVSLIAVNRDGSNLVLTTSSTVAGLGLALYDSNLNLLGNLPGTLPALGSFAGGVLFSADNSTIYELGSYEVDAAVVTINASSLAVLGVAPAGIAGTQALNGDFLTPTPFAVDATAMVLSLQSYGVSFDDATFYQNYAPAMPSDNSSTPLDATFGGPLAGGTVSSIHSFPALLPDVWFGQTRGSTSLSLGQLASTSPPSGAPGPVNVKFIYPDGEQALYPQLFSYSTFPQYAVTSGSAPNGGAAGQVIGYGLPQDASGGTLTVGGNTATITTPSEPYPPLSGEPYPSTILAYTFPSGTSGWADMKITTPIGTGTLPKSIFYANSVTDYASSDSATFTAVLLDTKRNQVYVSAGNHVDVFSTSSNQFVTALQPAANGSQKQFAGLALTPDGSQLVVADVVDGSIAVINPDSPSSTYAIAIAPVGQQNGCPVGPLYVAATSASQAIVTTGSIPATACPTAGSVYLVNVQANAVSQLAPSQCSSGQSVQATADGSLVVTGATSGGTAPCIYSTTSSSFNAVPLPTWFSGWGIAISADGNVVGAGQLLTDSSLNMLGSLAEPIPFYGPPNTSTPLVPLQFAQLNATGGLYYMPYANFFDIIDVQHAKLRTRFSLTETIQNTVAPLAIDSGGRYVYLLTNEGLTVVDMGAAPLSIGHLSVQSASPGAQVVVRGSGFDSGTVATVGGVLATVSFTDQNTLTLTIPAAATGPEDIVLTRGNGDTYTLENGIVVL